MAKASAVSCALSEVHGQRTDITAFLLHSLSKKRVSLSLSPSFSLSPLSLSIQNELFRAIALPCASRNTARESRITLINVNAVKQKHQRRGV